MEAFTKHNRKLSGQGTLFENITVRISITRVTKANSHIHALYLCQEFDFRIKEEHGDFFRFQRVHQEDQEIGFHRVL